MITFKIIFEDQKLEAVYNADNLYSVAITNLISGNIHDTVMTPKELAACLALMADSMAFEDIPELNNWFYALCGQKFDNIRKEFRMIP